MDRRLEEVDEAEAHVGRERGRQVFAPYEPTPQEDCGQGHLLLLRLVEGVLEVVTRKYVTLDERLSESPGLTGEHPDSPAAPVALPHYCGGLFWIRIGGPRRVLNPQWQVSAGVDAARDHPHGRPGGPPESGRGADRGSAAGAISERS